MINLFVLMTTFILLLSSNFYFMLLCYEIDYLNLTGELNLVGYVIPIALLTTSFMA